MIRAVADTNVYVPAIVFGGVCEAILALARTGLIDLFISPAIRGELRTVLEESFGWPEARVREALSEVDGLASIVRPARTLRGIVAHDPDHRILETALAARAAFLVTGDRKLLLPLQTFREIRIVSPRDFLDLLH